MNRKKAIISLFVIGGGATATFSGYKWYSIFKTPDIAFLENNQALVAGLAEIIIPATTTPGAKAANTEPAIIFMIKKVANRKTRNIFIDGLKETTQYALDRYHAPFTALTQVQQYEIVSHFQKKGSDYTGIIGKIKNKVIGKSFFQILKEYSTIAFCSSEKGATKALAFDEIPGAYHSCVPMIANQKSWATK